MRKANDFWYICVVVKLKSRCWPQRSSQAPANKSAAPELELTRSSTITKSITMGAFSNFRGDHSTIRQGHHWSEGDKAPNDYIEGG